MSGFTADWLALREPYDLRARNTAVLDAVVAAFAGRPCITIADLACGTGATLRALAPRLPAAQYWRLADNDLGLLARAANSARPARVSVTTVPLDLTRDLEAVLDGAVDLVTASALLDLVSAPWLERFTVEAAVRGIPIYAALNYDGRVAFDPPDADNDRIVAAVNAHQQWDKGFGPALGPAAASAAMARLGALGYRLRQGYSDWLFGPADRKMQAETCAGWAAAAVESGKVSRAEAAAWLRRRAETIAAGRSSIRVGHVDLFGESIRLR